MHRPAQRNLNTTFPETPKRVQNTNPTSRNMSTLYPYAQKKIRAPRQVRMWPHRMLFTVEVPQVASGSQSRPMPLKAGKGHLKAGQCRGGALVIVPVCMRIRTYTPRNTKSRAKEAFNEACLRVLAFESSLRALACIIYMCKKAMEALLQYADLGSPAYV